MSGKKIVKVVSAQLRAAAALRDGLSGFTFAPPVSRTYNPLVYAWPPFEEYVTRYGSGVKRVLFLGMNPGPWGMAQTGVPFGEVAAVRDWLGISAPVGRPEGEHPSYPVSGYLCGRSEVSGRRLWGLFMKRFGTAEAFFEEHFVVNYCPLLFLEAYLSDLPDLPDLPATTNGKERARNLTPDKLKAADREFLFGACDIHLRAVVEALRPEYLVGVGNFAAARAEALATGGHKTVKILHPSPASPKSNADWAGEASRQLTALGIW
jgi:single-strand selective monofunctional uracil DNA glycosylase